MSKETTIGAISGVFPTAAEQKLNAELASMSVGAQMARDVDAAEMATPAPHVGLCPICETQRYGDAAAPCPRCEQYRAQPERYYIGEDGTWWSR